MRMVPIKHCGNLNKRVLPETTPADREFEYVDIAAVSSDGAIARPPVPVTFGDAPSRARRIATGGSTVISTVRTYLRAIGFVDAEMAARSVFSTGLAVIEPSVEFDPRFFNYACRSERVVGEIVARSVGVSYPAIAPSDLGDILIPCPGLARQVLVADYLDEKCAAIDEAIHLRRLQSDALAERHVIAAREAVAGRKPGAGADGPNLLWLGHIRPGWDIVRFSRITRFYSGTTFPHAYQGHAVGSLPFVKVSDFARATPDLRLSDAENWISRETGKVLGARLVPSGSIAFARVGAALLLNQRRLLMQESVIDDNVRAVAVQGDPAYFLHLMCLFDFGELANPGPVPSVTESQIGSISVPVPPIDVQREIGRALDEASRDVAEVRREMARQIDLLRERKRSLITAAVSGEFDVTTASGRGV